MYIMAQHYVMGETRAKTEDKRFKHKRPNLANTNTMANYVVPPLVESGIK